MILHQFGVTIADPEQVVLDADPYRRLAYTWHTFTPEWAAVLRERMGFSDEFLAKVAAEPRSKVAFEIENLGGLVRLTVVHDDFEPGETLPQPVEAQAAAR